MRAARKGGRPPGRGRRGRADGQRAERARARANAPRWIATTASAIEKPRSEAGTDESNAELTGTTAATSMESMAGAKKAKKTIRFVCGPRKASAPAGSGMTPPTRPPLLLPVAPSRHSQSARPSGEKL